jgi:hypothetical protein
MTRDARATRPQASVTRNNGTLNMYESRIVGDDSNEENDCSDDDRTKCKQQPRPPFEIRGAKWHAAYYTLASLHIDAVEWDRVGLVLSSRQRGE